MPLPEQISLLTSNCGVLGALSFAEPLKIKEVTFSATENAACPVCGARDPQPVQTLRDRLWSRPGVFQMARCRVCSHGFLAVRPTQQGMGAYYEGLYDEGGLGVEEKLQRSVLAQLLNWRRMRALNARRRFQKGVRHLDVGCGVSSLLRQLASRGLAAVGLDFEEAACQSQRAYCQDLTVELWRGTLEEARDENGEVIEEQKGQFASASMIHYLEHAFTPVEDLQRVCEMLEPGGAVVVEVPSIESFHRSLFRSYWLPYLPPQHISLFSRRSLRRALRDAGFVGVRVRGASAPFIGLSSFAIWWTWTLGRKSSLPRPLQIAFWPVALVQGLVVAVGDLASFWWLAKSGHADHLRATAIKPRSSRK